MLDYHYGDVLLSIKDVSLQFNKKVVLRDLNLEISDIIRPNTTTGQVITLLGPSGIGKTQLMKMIAGLQEPTTGEILIGIDKQHPIAGRVGMVTENLPILRAKPVAGKIGMVLQTYPLFEHRTVMSNLELVSNDKEKIRNLLESFDVWEHRKKYPSQLSGGQRQRIAIIQQVLSSEHFILFDEPFSGLDPLAIKKLSESIRKLADMEDDNTIIISSHILSPSLAVSDTAIMLGKEKDKEGATITYQWDLIAQDLAWHENIRRDARFIQFCNSVEDEFYK